MACTDLGQRSFLKVKMWDGCDMILQTSTGVTWRLFKVNGPRLFQHSGSQEMPIFCSFHRIVNSHLVQVLNILQWVFVSLVSYIISRNNYAAPFCQQTCSFCPILLSFLGFQHYAKSNLKSQYIHQGRSQYISYAVLYSLPQSPVLFKFSVISQSLETCN